MLRRGGQGQEGTEKEVEVGEALRAHPLHRLHLLVALRATAARRYCLPLLQPLPLLLLLLLQPLL
jgi:hypothetical protein